MQEKEQGDGGIRGVSGDDGPAAVRRQQRRQTDHANDRRDVGVDRQPGQQRLQAHCLDPLQEVTARAFPRPRHDNMGWRIVIVNRPEQRYCHHKSR